MSFKLFRALLAGTLLLSAAFAQAASKKAAEFNLPALSGGNVALSQFKGKVVFLDFWASWCPPCRMSIPTVEKVYEQYKDRGAVFLGINVENDVAAAKQFAEKAGIKYTVLLGDQKVARDYAVRGIPAFFIVAPDGTVAAKYVGFQPGMENEWQKELDRLLPPPSQPRKGPSSPRH